MNVNELRDRILEISHNEVAPDTNLQIKALAWLNSAYQELISDSLPYLTQFLETSSSAVLDEGTGTLPDNLTRVLKVIDKNTNYVLKQISQAQAIENITGSPKYHWVEGINICTYPKSTGTLKIVYLKQVNDLEDGGLESEIFIPKQFHHGLVWGGLVWSSIFERGFSSQGDLKLFQLKWEDVKRELKLSLASQPTKNLRVKPYDLDLA